jgi:UDP-2-acetamido-3-amino-2,3-dideoxy-glucuronate N-acetyltransferase
MKDDVGVEIHALSKFVDERGTLSVLEFQKEIGFTAARLFIIGDTPKNQVRGNHAHRQSTQVFLWLEGEIELTFKSKTKQTTHTLSSANNVYLCPPGIWGIQKFIVPGSKLLVLSDFSYDVDDYIANYDDFLNYESTN